jgi:hypothetical protein
MGDFNINESSLSVFFFYVLCFWGLVLKNSLPTLRLQRYPSSLAVRCLIRATYHSATLPQTRTKVTEVSDHGRTTLEISQTETRTL